MRSSMCQTLCLLVMLGASEGLTLTRDENIALALVKTGGAPAKNIALSYPLNGAKGIHKSENIVVTFDVDNTLASKAFANNLNVKLTYKDKVGGTADTSKDIIIPVSDAQVSIRNGVGTGTQFNVKKAFVHINPYQDLEKGNYAVSVTVAAFEDSTTTPLDSGAFSGIAFDVQDSCDESDMTGTDAEDATRCTDSRPDCVWTGKCEAKVISVSGAKVGFGSKECNGQKGTQWPTGGTVLAGNFANPGCASLECVNGEYVSHGLKNGKPFYKGTHTLAPLEHGGAFIQFETSDSATLTGHRANGNNGWVAVCGGAARFGSPDTDGSAAAGSPEGSGTWTNVLAQSADDNNANAYAIGPITIAEASCTEPLGTEKRAPYGWATAQPDNSLARGSFGPDISCAPGYSGSAKATNCPKNGDEYTLSGCTKNSSRRRRRKHSNPWPNNKNQAAPATWNPFWTFWDAIGF